MMAQIWEMPNRKSVFFWEGFPYVPVSYGLLSDNRGLGPHLKKLSLSLYGGARFWRTFSYFQGVVLVV